MYKVIQTYGDNEPWWFFDDWQEDITFQKEFQHFEEAKSFFEQTFTKMTKEFPKIHTKENYLSAFWQEGDERWCDECDDYLQQIHGLLLLEEGKPLNKKQDIFETTVKLSPTKNKVCSIKVDRSN